MYPYSATALNNAGTDFQQLEPEGIRLGIGQFCVLERFPQKPDEAIGKSMKEETELVGKETVATETICLEMILEFFDPVFHVTPMHVDIVIQFLGNARQVGNHESSIGSLRHAFDLGNYPTAAMP